MADRLSIEALSRHLGLDLAPLSSFWATCPEEVLKLYTHSGRRAAFSAAAVCGPDGAPSGIVYNDAHQLERQRADIAHECAHVLLEHDPSTRIGENGERVYPEAEEDEAHWLGPTLLVPRAGMIRFLRQTPTLEAAAQHFEVSIELARMRYHPVGLKRVVPLAPSVVS